MTLTRTFLKSIGGSVSLAILFTLSSAMFNEAPCAITISTGEPAKGGLIDGVPFPSRLHGFKVGKPDASYTTPEVVGALSAAVEKLEERYPGSCDVLLGAFSRKGGGRLKGHGSHQNGRDVDVGLFAKGNVPLDRFVPMDSSILDVPKTWAMIRCLLDTQRVEHIYLDTSIQAQLVQHALREGDDRGFLSKVFKSVGGAAEKDCVVQYEPGHRNHMHVRFSSPWSTLAGKVRDMDPRQRKAIELAQAHYLSPGSDVYAKNVDNAAPHRLNDFTVGPEDLWQWSNPGGGAIPGPGESLVFVNRAIEPEPLRLARSLRYRGSNGAQSEFLFPESAGNAPFLP